MIDFTFTLHPATLFPQRGMATEKVNILFCCRLSGLSLVKWNWIIYFVRRINNLNTLTNHKYIIGLDCLHSIWEDCNVYRGLNNMYKPNKEAYERLEWLIFTKTHNVSCISGGYGIHTGLSCLVMFGWGCESCHRRLTSGRPMK